MRLLNSFTVPLGFLTSIMLQNIETNQGTLWCNPKIFKKSLIVPKNTKIAKGGSLVQVVEQMNKKVDLTRIEKHYAL